MYKHALYSTLKSICLFLVLKMFVSLPVYIILIHLILSGTKFLLYYGKIHPDTMVKITR